MQFAVEVGLSHTAVSKVITRYKTEGSAALAPRIRGANVPGRIAQEGLIRKEWHEGQTRITSPWQSHHWFDACPIPLKRTGAKSFDPLTRHRMVKFKCGCMQH